MADPISRFQAELKNKLSFKASSKVSIDTLLFKTFKFFDLNNLGYVPQTEFYRTIAKVGVVFETPDIMKEVFKHYDRDGTGKIKYREFIEEVLFKNDKPTTTDNQQQGKQDEPRQEHLKSEQPKLQRQHTSMKVETGKSRTVQFQERPTVPPISHPQQLIKFIQGTLKSSGPQSLISLAVQLKEQDVNKSHKIGADRIRTVLNWLGKDHVTILLSCYKLPADGLLNYAQFIYSLIEPVSPERIALTRTTFESLGKNEEEVPIEAVLKRYRDNSAVSKNSFDRAVGLYCKFQNITDGIFTFQDFEDFVGFIGFTFTSDEKFRSWILKAYGEEDEVMSVKSVRSRQFRPESRVQEETASQKLAELKVNMNVEPPKDAFKKQVNESHRRQLIEQSQKSIKSKALSTKSSKYVKEMQLILLRIKKRLASKGACGYLVFQKALKGADSDADMLVNIHQFKKVIKDQKIDITQTEASMVFEVFDQEATGLLNYPQFVYALRGEVTESRQKLIDRVYEKVKLPGQEHTSYNQIKHLFSARSHPDIRNGRRFEQDILNEMNQSLLCVQDLNGVRSQEISKQDFIEYLQNLSASVADDQLFETILTNIWKLESVNRIEDQYAGSKKRFDMKKNSYLIDHHRYMINGGSVSQNAPFGTYNEPTPYKN